MNEILIVIEKSLRRLTVYRDGEAVKQFPVVLGNSPVGPKEERGDGKTPEGEYYVCTRNEQSKFHLFLGLSYPNLEDAHKALAKGLITEEDHNSIISSHSRKVRPPWDTALGGEVGIHGYGGHGGHGIEGDWTAGCIAVTNEAIEELWDLSPLGTIVQIKK
jgi:murein L,D-transpeptidase YafK